MVFAAADEGSARAVGRLIDWGAVGTAVVAAGSVITQQPRLAQAFAEELGRRHPQM